MNVKKGKNGSRMTAAMMRRILIALFMAIFFVLPNGKAKNGETSQLLVHSTSLLLLLVGRRDGVDLSGRVARIRRLVLTPRGKRKAPARTSPLPLPHRTTSNETMNTAQYTGCT